MLSLRNLVREGATRLSAGPHGDRARADAELLLLHVLGKDRVWLMIHTNKVLTEVEISNYRALLERRVHGEPIQYLTGETEFYRMPFRVTPDVLIPRPETELLVERVTQLVPVFLPRSDHFIEFRKISPHIWHSAANTTNSEESESKTNTTSHAPRIVDVGTGSGAIAVSIARDWQESEITAIDISPAALDIAHSNAERLGFADQIRFLEGDLLSPVAGERFEIIVSNPPYVAEADRAGLSVEVREYEPAMALFAGDDGLEIYHRLIPAAFRALPPGGFLALEIGFGQSPAIRALLADSGFEQIEFTPDLQGIPRVACARRPTI